jgi:uncharacterized membrane protein YebE (DUF533 family)
MGAIQSFFATYGPGALIGMVVGWIAFKEFASTPNCGGVLAAIGGCPELWLGMTFAQFVGGCAALGGLFTLVYQMWKGEIL